MKKKHQLQGRKKFFSLTEKICLIMKLTFLLTIICVLQATAVISQNMVANIHIKNAPLEQFFSEIEQQTSIKFLYRYENIEGKIVSVNMENASVDKLLDAILPETGLIYSHMKNNLIVISAANQQKTVTGLVVDEKGAPLYGVNVVIKGTAKGTTTDFNGKYSLSVPNEQTILQFSFIGFVMQEITVGEKSAINITLLEDTKSIEEVVVTALGIEKSKRSLSYTTEQVEVESLTTVRDPSLATSISGKVAGVSISNSSGASGVGGSSRIIIRGNRSISGGNQPLIVVDGVPYSNSKGVISSSSGTREVDSFDGFSNINGDDVQSINILKGPAAAALYGSAANNGVIIVTTKKGKLGSPQVEFNSITTVDLPYLYPDLQNEYAQGAGGIYNSTIEIQSWGPKMTGQTVTNWTGEETKLTPQPNNVKDFYENGYNLTNTLSYSTGSEKSTTYFSYSNTTAKGVLKTDKLQRHNFNLRLSAELIPKLKLDFKMTYFRQEMENRPASGDDYFSPMQSLLRMPRSMRTQDIENFEYYTAEGSLKQNMWVPGGTDKVLNPYWAMYRRVAPTSRDRVTTFASLRYDITDWLWAQGRVSLDAIHDDGEEKIYWDASYINDGTGNYFTAFSKGKNVTSDFMLNFHKDLDNGLGFSAMAGAEIKDSKARSQTATTNGLTVENKFALNYGKSNTTTDGESRTQIQSVFGTAQVSYKSMLYLDFTARNDWNSTLPAPYDYFYPSAGITGILSDIFEMPDFISFAKVRASYAEVGSGAGFASIFQTYGRNTDGPIGQITTSGSKVAEKLIPERSKSWEAGTELKLFKNRLGIDFTWYKSNTINQLINVKAPPTSGYTSTQINCGDIQNTGVEIMISATPVENAIFSWDTYLTFSKNKNELKELYKGVDEYVLSGANLALGESRVEVGHPYGEIYSRGFRRDDQGRIIVASTGLPMITADADTYLGNFNYDWQSGLSNTLRYKNWHMNFLIDLNYGGVRQSATESMLAATGGGKATLYGRDGFVFDGVKEDGSVNDIQINAEAYWTVVGGRSSNNGPVELFNHEATNSRLRELSIGYKIPVRSSIVRSLVISAVGRNLFYFYNGCDWFDPDVTYDTGVNGQGAENSFHPGSRTLGFNIKLSM